MSSASFSLQRPISSSLPLVCLLLLSLLLVTTKAFTCSPAHALSESVGPNGLCECNPGWYGPTCEICTTDQACGILLRDSDGICRNDTFTAIRESFGWCAIANEDVTNLIHGDGFVQIYYAANGTFFFDFVKRRGDGDYLSLFRCHSKKTKVTEDPKLGQVKYSSPDLVCNMTCVIGSDRTCTQGLSGIVDQVGAKGGSKITCDPAARTCDVQEATLDLFLGGVQTTGCYMSECARRGETVVVSTGSFANIARQPPAQQVSYILGLAMLVATLVILVLASSYSWKSGGFSGSHAGAARLLAGKMTGDKGGFVAGMAETDQGKHAEGGGLPMASPGAQRLREEEAGVLPGSLGGAGMAMAAAAGGLGTQGSGVIGGAGLGGKKSKACPVVWDGVTYTVAGKQVLKGVSGYALPGELFALMGPSGSGKTTMIDILAMKNKRGQVGGRVYYGNGLRKAYGEDPSADERVRESVGFVDQEDNLMGTLTVYEAVLFSAFLRLPDRISVEGKTERVLQVLQDLRIAHVADSMIGSQGRRGISGGEKRRVVVAMEMVKVPAVLFLDEPTSGLDSFNAALLVDCLRGLARRNATNVVMTIHQPRSNVFAGFDRILVLNQGEMTWFGKAKEVDAYYASIGHSIPSHYNPADFLIDVLFTAEGGEREAGERRNPVATGENKGKWWPLQVFGRKKSLASGLEGAENTRKEVELAHGWGKENGAGVGKAGGAPASETAGSRPLASRPAPGPSQSVRVDMGEEGMEGGLMLQDSAFKHNTQEEERREREDVGVSPPTSLSGPFLRHHTNSSSRNSTSLSGAEERPDAAAAHKLEHASEKPSISPFAEAFRRSDAYQALVVDMASLLGPRGKDGETGLEGEGEGSNSSGSEGTLVTLSPVEHLEEDGSQGVKCVDPAARASGLGDPSRVSWRARAWKGLRRWCWEIGVLSHRSVLDLARNPVLFWSHAGATAYFAVILGIVYFDLSMSSLQAIQNRLGAFLLSCVFLCFTSVSALPLFWLERNLYLHEQSNRFYMASAYFVCKVFFDLIPLRVVPTVLFGSITYGMIGLRPGFQHFIIYQAFLVLLVCTSALINLIIGMLTRHIMSGILIATIVMIHFLMLTNLFVNFDSMSVSWLKFLRRVSFFNYAYEGTCLSGGGGRRGKEGRKQGATWFWFMHVAFRSYIGNHSHADKLPSLPSLSLRRLERKRAGRATSRELCHQHRVRRPP